MIIEVTPEIKELFLDKLQTRLINGEVINHYESCTKTVQSFDGEGNLIGSQESKTEKRKTTILPTPQCDIDLIAKSMSDEEAAKFLMAHGYNVSNPELAKSDKQQKGISEQTVEDIKRRLLGIDSNAHKVVVAEVVESTETFED